MHDIKCPHCGKKLVIGEREYADILEQVRSTEFQRELKERTEQLESEGTRRMELLKERQERNAEHSLFAKDKQIQELENSIRILKAENMLHTTEMLSQKEREIQELKGRQSLMEKETALELSSLKQHFQGELSQKDEAIAFYKDFKAKQSTKMIGESLERHCELSFEKMRAIAFPNAEFHKDNDIRTGSKGDYIFREWADGITVISIMFEMKNEGDGTSTKKKNVDFLRELDRDRREKECEYAVLVSMLEADNDLYNDGIVDVSHLYPKMFVIRPQFFLGLIGLLRNGAFGALEYKREVELVRRTNVDVTRFEEKLETFRNGFSRNYELASRKFQGAIGEIDRAIERLQKVKSELLGSENQLRLANQKAEDLTVRSLTHGNETMRELISEARGKSAV